LYFYLLIALLVSGSNEVMPERRSSRWLVPVGVAVGVAASLLFAAFAVRLLVADRALAVANGRIESGDASAAAREYLVVLRWEPSGAGADLNYSRAMAQLAARAPVLSTRVQAAQQALEAAIRATQTAEDRQNAWYNLARLLAGQNNPVGVERALRNAIAWAPNWFKPHWVLAQLLESTGLHQQALAEAEIAFDLDHARDPEVSETWRKLQRGPASPQP
jgi:tetratricopeptide (TPR) repeat protein